MRSNDKTAEKRPRRKAEPVGFTVEKVVYLPQAEALLTRQQVARLLSISLRSLASMIARGEYPKADVRLGPQQPRWRVATHDAWVRKRAGVQDGADDLGSVPARRRTNGG
jgi:predicted DNA-binding transcriptional regulator AlpA